MKYGGAAWYWLTGAQVPGHSVLPARPFGSAAVRSKPAPVGCHRCCSQGWSSRCDAVHTGITCSVLCPVGQQRLGTAAWKRSGPDKLIITQLTSFIDDKSPVCVGLNIGRCLTGLVFFFNGSTCSYHLQERNVMFWNKSGGKPKAEPFYLAGFYFCFPSRCSCEAMPGAQRAVGICASSK